MSFLTLDIETAPLPQFVDPDRILADSGAIEEKWLKEYMTAYDADPDGHLRDKLRSLVSDGNVPLAATGVAPGLHATTCRVVQVSYGWRDAGGKVQTQLCQLDQFEDETDLLRHALAILHSATAVRRTRLVTFNGKQFDLPVLRARAAILRLRPEPVPWRRLLYPYSDDQHADLRLVLGADDRRARGTLQWWADTFGIHAEEHGQDVFGWVRAGEWEKLRAYGVTEAQTLIELFEAVMYVL